MRHIVLETGMNTKAATFGTAGMFGFVCPDFDANTFVKAGKPDTKIPIRSPYT